MRYENLKGYKLLHEGCLALTKAEEHGFRIDVEYCKEQEKRLENEINEEKEKLYSSDFIKLWRRYKGTKFNIDSNQQLSDYLFKKCGIKSVKQTAKGNNSTDEEALSGIDIPEVQRLLRIRKLLKTKDTYFAQLTREVANGFAHPFYHLNTARTFRSSCSNPNFQNIPIRDPEMGRLIRTAIIPRPGNHLVEIDYSGVEVSISCCYHKDKNMIKYVTDKSTDMHRDMAQQCFKLKPRRWNEIDKKLAKNIRGAAKNQFVFPQFYGDWYGACAETLWKTANTHDIEEGVKLVKHLNKMGIRNLTQFKNHIQEVEDDFWNNRFAGYTVWKKKQIKDYNRRGWISLKTGFKCRGDMSDKDVTNYPIQGSAFHVLLWSFIHVTKWLEEMRMESRLIGQVHDSMIADVPPEELKLFLKNVQRISCVKIREVWKWINVPLAVDAEVSPVDCSWYEKKDYVI